MIGALLKAIEQLPDRRFLKVVLLGIGGAAVALVCLWYVSHWALAQIAWAELPLIGGLVVWMSEWADEVGLIAFLIGAGGLTWLLFPVTAVAVISIFLDSICDAVEARHYPNRPEAREQPMLEIVFQALKFLGITVAINLLALPIYLVLLIAFGSGAIVFIVVNGYLVSREFFELVAVRRMSLKAATRMRKAYSLKLMVFGVVAVFLMTIPLINLIAPVLVAAAMVHLYESLPRKEEFEALDGSATVVMKGDR
jgi:CysZ protein